MKKKTKFILTFLPVAGIFFICASLFASSNNLMDKNIVNQSSISLVNQATTKSSSYVDFYNPGSNFIDPQLKAKVVNIFNKKPSQVDQNDINTLLIFLDPTIVQLGFTNSPKFENLNLQTSSSLPTSTPLEVFSSTSSSTNPFSTNYLDSIGVLGFKLTLTNNANTNYYQYFLMSGFNSQIIRTSLPGSEYQYTVNEVPDSKLSTFINFSATSVIPSVSLVPNSRVNNEKEGTIGFSLNLLYNLPTNLNFNISNLTSRYPSDNPLPSASNIFTINTTYDQSFSYTGFQPGNALTNNQIYAIVGIVAGAVVVLILIIALFTYIFKKIRFRKD